MGLTACGLVVDELGSMIAKGTWKQKAGRLSVSADEPRANTKKNLAEAQAWCLAVVNIIGAMRKHDA